MFITMYSNIQIQIKLSKQITLAETSYCEIKCAVISPKTINFASYIR